MPAGHNCPPHPDLRSSCSFNGLSASNDEKSILLVVGVLYSGKGARSSPIANGENSGEDDREPCLTNAIFFCKYPSPLLPLLVTLSQCYSLY